MAIQARNIDPREALLAHAEAAKEDPFWMGSAYGVNQPETLFSTKTKEQEDAETAKLKKDLGHYQKTKDAEHTTRKPPS